MKLLFIFFLLTPFANSAQKITDPEEYLELFGMIHYTASTQIYAISFMAKEEGDDAKENLQQYRSLLIETFGQIIRDLEELGDFEGNNELNRTTLEGMEFYEKLVTDHYDQYVAFFQNKESMEDAEMIELIANIVNEEAKHRSAYFDAREAFAKKYGLELKD